MSEFMDNFWKWEEKIDSDARLEIEQHREDILSLKLRNLSDKALDLLTSGIFDSGKVSMDKRIKSKAKLTLQGRIFNRTPSHRKLLDDIANNRCTVDGPVDDIKRLYKKAEDYKKRQECLQAIKNTVKSIFHII